MDLTIVIVNWNGGELLMRCLESIRACNTTFKITTLVIDNDSSDGSREAAQQAFPEFSIINSGSNMGFGRANNLAKPMIKTPLILFLNPDTEVRKNALQVAVDQLSSMPKVGALGCKMLYPDGRIQEQGLQWFPTPLTFAVEFLLVTKRTFKILKRWLPSIDPKQSSHVRKLYGGFVLIRKEAMDQTGWFDDRYFMYAEDVDLSRTLMDAGWELYYSAETEIIHVAGGTTAKAPSGFSILMKHESVEKYMRKYHGFLGALAYRAVVLVGSGARLATLAFWRLFSRASAEKQGSLEKQKMACLWALGRRRAKVAASRPNPNPALRFA